MVHGQMPGGWMKKDATFPGSSLAVAKSKTLMATHNYYDLVLFSHLSGSEKGRSTNQETGSCI